MGTFYYKNIFLISVYFDSFAALPLLFFFPVTLQQTVYLCGAYRKVLGIHGLALRLFEESTGNLQGRRRPPIT